MKTKIAEKSTCEYKKEDAELDISAVVRDYLDNCPSTFYPSSDEIAALIVGSIIDDSIRNVNFEGK